MGWSFQILFFVCSAALDYSSFLDSRNKAGAWRTGNAMLSVTVTQFFVFVFFFLLSRTNQRLQTGEHINIHSNVTTQSTGKDSRAV